MMVVFYFIGAITAPLEVFAADYDIDAEHTHIMFQIKHMGISNVKGSFDRFQGTFSFDPENIKAAKASANISTESINTGVKKRDDHLRSDEFFGAAKHPSITFVSKEISEIDGNSFKVSGDLSIAGITKQITLDAEFGGIAKDPWGNERAAFSASTKINRHDFGITWNKVLETGGLVVGDDVKISIEVEGIRKQEKAGEKSAQK
ncbi:MAG: polyisoprenoid-binding protein [Deltaproteobacteria bacterium]|nr:polyisoprenoid-binding protein [Deltaproteobacteria bacterium]